MKRVLVFALMVAWMISRCFAQVQITDFDRTGVLSWTNRFCTTEPVYEVLRANSLTSRWDHVLFATNQTTAVVTDFGTNQSCAAFFKLAWIHDSPLVLNYAFDEGYGFIAVTGRLSVTLFSIPDAGTWVCGETEYVIDQQHPVGSGQLFGAPSLTGDTMQLQLRKPGDPGCFECGTFLDGILERVSSGGKCAYTQYYGEVFQQMFGGPESIGSFFAARVP